MIYPLLPVFLKSVLGASAVALGVIEGFAEFVSSSLKILSGIWADKLPRKKPLVLAGYGISSILRPLIGLANSWFTVWLFRMGDRVGKGIRTSPRDALIADVTDENSRGRAYGIQRSLDNAGAVVGPLVAAGLIALGFGLRQVFLFAFIPSIFVIFILVFILKEKDRKISEASHKPVLTEWKDLGKNFHIVILGVVIFTLGNSTDAFLLLRLNDAGINAEWIALLWAVHNFIKVVTSVAGGILSDKIGRRPLVLSGWIYYAGIYIAFALVDHPTALIIVFLLYGIFYGLTEPTEKAWVADMAPQSLRGSAFGWYNGAIGLSTLPASIIFGTIWHKFGVQYAFFTGAGLAILASVILMFVQNQNSQSAAD